MAFAKHPVRNGLTWLLAMGATCSIGFLAFAGMFLVTPSLPLAIIAGLLASAFEAQIYEEGIKKSLKRFLDPDYPALAVIKQKLDWLCDQEELQNDPGAGELIQSWTAAKQKLAEQKNTLHELQKKKDACAPSWLSWLFEKDFKKDREAREEYSRQIRRCKYDIHGAKEELLRLQKTFMSVLSGDSQASSKWQEEAARSLIKNHDTFKTLAKDIAHQKRWERAGDFVTAIAGISAGMVTWVSMQTGLFSLAVAFPFLSAIPGGILIVLAVLAAGGYAWLMQEKVSDMLLDMKWKSRLTKRESESALRYATRITVTAIAIGLAIFATVATVGTWWPATQFVMARGATLFNAITIPFTALATLIFNVQNSVESVENAFPEEKIPQESAFSRLCVAVQTTWQSEKRIQFINPFRILEKTLSYSAQTVFLLGHIASIGVTADRLGNIDPKETAAPVSVNEWMTDSNYLPGQHGHTHESFLLTLLMSPVKVAAFLLKVFAILWDVATSREHKFETSFRKIFDKPCPAPVIQPDSSPEIATSPVLQVRRSNERIESSLASVNAAGNPLTIPLQESPSVAATACLPSFRISRSNNLLFSGNWRQAPNTSHATLRMACRPPSKNTAAVTP